MRDDSIKEAVLSDDTIIEYRMHLYADYRIQIHKRGNISNKMKELGRLPIELKKHGISSIYKAMNRCNWENLIISVQELCKFEPTSDRYGIPSLACKVGQSLKYIAEDKSLHYIKSGVIVETFLKHFIQQPGKIIGRYSQMIRHSRQR